MPSSPSQPDVRSWGRLKEIVAGALELPAPEREGFVREHAGDSGVLLEESLQLIRAADSSEALLHPDVDEWLGLRGGAITSLSGSRLGRYEVVRLIGEGAAGAVYEARQPGMKRPVALKLLRTHLIAGDAEHRFKREVEALGRVDHPGIARIYDAGIADGPDGRRVPYIAMEYVAGQPLHEYVRSRQLGDVAKVRLVVQIADAVHAAHQRAVVHRDLKPANVMVDASGHPKLLDFSIAHILESEAAQTVRTTTGLLLGTLGYMSPEQAAGDGDQVDVRSDVYSLGVMLFEMLAGRTPIETRGLSLPAALRRLAEADPPPLGQVQGRFADDLQTIVATALARRKEERYTAASAFADDLRRWLDHRPISARPPTALYLTRKFLRRHRGLLTVATMMLLLLLGGLVMTSLGFLRAERALARLIQAEAVTRQALDRALESERETAAVNRYLQRLFLAPDPAEMGAEARVLDWVLWAEPLLETELAGQTKVEADLRRVLGWTLYSLEEYEQAIRQLDAAAEAAAEVFGEHSPGWLEIQALKVMALRHAGQINEAGALLDRLGPVIDAALPPEHELRVQFGIEQAVQLQVAGRYDEALELFDRLLAAAKVVLPEDDAIRRSLVGEFTQGLMNAGRDGEAIVILESLLNSYRERLGEEHPRTLAIEGNLGVALRSAGRLEESVALLRHNVEASSRQWGAHGPTTLTAMSELAGSLTAAGRFEEADTIFAEATSGLLQRLGADNLKTQQVRNNHATMLLYAERWEEALAILATTTPWFANRFGPDAPYTLMARQNFAAALEFAGRLEEAMEQLGQVIEQFERTIGRKHRQTIITRNNLAMMHFACGDASLAATQLEEVVADAVETELIVEQILFRRNLGRALWGAGRLEDAERALLEAWEAGVEHLPPHQQQRTAGFLRDFFEDTGRPEKGAEWGLRAAGEDDGEV